MPHGLGALLDDQSISAFNPDPVGRENPPIVGIASIAGKQTEASTCLPTPSGANGREIP
jgi:hypothetical protein